MLPCGSLLAALLATLVLSSSAIAAGPPSYREWFLQVREEHGNDFEFTFMIYPFFPPHTNHVLCMTTDGEYVWAGTMNGVLRADPDSGSMLRIAYAEELSAAQFADYRPDHEVDFLDNIERHARVSRIGVTPDGNVWAKCGIGALLIAQDGRVLEDYRNDFEAIERLYDGQAHPGLLETLYPVDGARKVYLHWEGCWLALRHGPSGWDLWRLPEWVMGGDETSVEQLMEADGHVIVAAESLMLDAETGRVIGPYVGFLGKVDGDGPYSLCMAEYPSPITAENVGSLRTGLVVGSMSDEGLSWGRGGGTLRLADAGMVHGALSGVQHGGTVYIAFVRADGAIEVLVDPEEGRPWTIGAKDGLPLRPVEVDGRPGARVNRYGTNDYITSLFVDSAGNLWVGTTCGVAKIAGGKVVERLDLAPSDSPAAEDPWVTENPWTPMDGVWVTSITETPDARIWFGTFRGIASYDGKQLKWHVTDEPPHPAHERAAVRREVEAQGIPGPQLPDATDASLEHLEGSTALQRLDLNRTALTDAGLAHLKGLAELSTLDLRRTRITDAGLAHLKGLTELRRLDLGETKVTDAGLEYLEGLTGLAALDLTGTQVTDAGLEHLEGLMTLRTLDLSHTEVTDVGLEHLAGLTALQALDLSYTQVTDVGLEHLEGLTGLRMLDLGGTQVADAGLHHLGRFTALRMLDLGGTQVTDAGLAHLAGLTALQELDLHDTDVTGAGLEHLAGLPALRTLDLAFTRVTDAGLAHLAGLTALQELHLARTAVTDAGLEHLKGLPALQTLYLWEAQVTDAGVEQLRRALPNLRVSR